MELRKGIGHKKCNKHIIFEGMHRNHIENGCLNLPDRSKWTSKKPIPRSKLSIAVKPKGFPSLPLKRCITGFIQDDSTAEICTSFGIKVYFADPYSSWQRGSNENANGLLLRYFPKGHDFGKVTEDELEYILSVMNNHPRQCLSWKSTHESFQSELLHLD